MQFLQNTRSVISHTFHNKHRHWYLNKDNTSITNTYANTETVVN